MKKIASLILGDLSETSLTAVAIAATVNRWVLPVKPALSGLTVPIEIPRSEPVETMASHLRAIVAVDRVEVRLTGEQPCGPTPGFGDSETGVPYKGGRFHNQSQDTVFLCPAGSDERWADLSVGSQLDWESVLGHEMVHWAVRLHCGAASRPIASERAKNMTHAWASMETPVYLPRYGAPAVEDREIVRAIKTGKCA